MCLRVVADQRRGLDSRCDEKDGGWGEHFACGWAWLLADKGSGFPLRPERRGVGRTFCVWVGVVACRQGLWFPVATRKTGGWRGHFACEWAWLLAKIRADVGARHDFYEPYGGRGTPGIAYRGCYTGRARVVGCCRTWAVLITASAVARDEYLLAGPPQSSAQPSASIVADWQ